MSKKEKSAPSILASGLKDSLESLQASLDEWAAVENEVKDAPAKTKPAENQSKATDKELMGPIENKILQKIKNEYQPILLDIENESNKHASDYGLESHFKIILVSEKFVDQKRIIRSREVHKLLKEEIEKIHALSLRLFSQSEWDALEDKSSLLSPKCAGNH